MMVRFGLLLSWLVAGCAEKEAPVGDTDDGPEVVDSDEPVDSGEPVDSAEPLAPSISASFEPATVAASESAELVVTIENFTVVDPTALPAPVPTEGEGHFYVYYDGTLFTAAWTSPLTIRTSSDDPAGDYVFTLELVDSGHTAVAPAVATEATLVIE